MNKMYTNKFILGLLICLLSGAAQAKGIAFEAEGWQAIKAKAKKENKLVFVDVYTVWCGPCKQMDKKIFSDDKVGEFYNANFIPVKIDAEKGEGVEFAREYGVRSFPTLLFFDGEGKQINRRNGGFSTPEKFIAFGKKTLDSEKEFASASSLYNQGKRDPKLILKYLSLLKERGLPTEEVALTYFNTMERESWIASENLKLIEKYLHSPYSEVIAYLEKNKESQETLKTMTSLSPIRPNSIYHTLFRLYGRYIYTDIAKNRDNKQKDTVFLSHIKSNLYPDDAEQLTFLAKRVIFGSDKDWKRYAEVVIDYVDKHPSVKNNALALNNYAYLFYKNDVTDALHLNSALGWINTALEITNEDNPHYSNYLDTQASLLYKLGRKKEALEVANETIELAKKHGVGYSDTVTLIKKIKAN